MYGALTDEAIGFILKDVLLRRAMREILSQIGMFEAFGKADYAGRAGHDVVTTADQKAQDIYKRLLAEGIPDCQALAEEDGLVVPGIFDDSMYLTIDPLDGTKNYVRGESRGVGSMIALACGRIVLAAYVGDVNTGEVFGYRPGGHKVWHLRELGLQMHRVSLTDVPRVPLSELPVILRAEREGYHPLIAEIARSTARGGIFKQYDIERGSIGLSHSRLWRGLAGAHVSKQGGFSTPWDDTPVIGIGRRLGMVWLRPLADGSGFQKYVPWLPRTVELRQHDSIVLHGSRLPEFNAAVSRVTGNDIV